MRILRPYSIRRVQVLHDGQENHAQQKFQLMHNESEVLAEFDITEIRKVKQVFDEWIDPYEVKAQP